ncbi:CDP-diacylglycerol--serine O-phosphatidyltransferase [bacterium]|nr:MAG: CDP-diacylglycerol--serine O-phosphatidyltransferase [bacterium]
MNLLSGFMAIVMIMENKLEFGAWLIVLAGLFDLMDGFMARLANATSNFGIELDSLSDIVSFGVAPGILIYKYALFQIAVPGIIVASLPALFGAVRLARFNVEAVTANYSYFRGLPIPAQATMNVAFFLTFQNQFEIFDVFQNGVKSVLIPLVILLSLLMVSTVPFDKVPRFTGPVDKKQKGLILLYIGYLVTILVFQEYGLMAVFSFFIVRAIVKASIKFWKEINEDDIEEDSDDGTFQSEPLRE